MRMDFLREKDTFFFSRLYANNENDWNYKKSLIYINTYTYNLLNTLLIGSEIVTVHS